MKLIIFDLDGTLINSIEDLGVAVNHALALRNFPEHVIDEFYMMVGHGVRNLVKAAMPEGLRDDEKLLDAVLADFVEYYSAHIDVHTRPYPGIPELVDRLSAAGYHLAVASNKFQSGAEVLVSKLFPSTDFVEVLGNSPDAPLKPSPEVVNRIMVHASEAGTMDLGDVIMVGDSSTDIKTAANAGIPSIAVSWGFRPAESLTAATYLATAPEDIDAIVEKAIGRP